MHQLLHGAGRPCGALVVEVGDGPWQSGGEGPEELAGQGDSPDGMHARDDRSQGAIAAARPGGQGDSGHESGPTHIQPNSHRPGLFYARDSNENFEDMLLDADGIGSALPAEVDRVGTAELVEPQQILELGSAPYVPQRDRRQGCPEDARLAMNAVGAQIVPFTETGEFGEVTRAHFEAKTGGGFVPLVDYPSVQEACDGLAALIADSQRPGADPDVDEQEAHETEAEPRVCAVFLLEELRADGQVLDQHVSVMRWFDERESNGGTTLPAGVYVIDQLRYSEYGSDGVPYELWRPDDRTVSVARIEEVRVEPAGPGGATLVPRYTVADADRLFPQRQAWLSGRPIAMSNSGDERPPKPKAWIARIGRRRRDTVATPPDAASEGVPLTIPGEQSRVAPGNGRLILPGEQSGIAPEGGRLILPGDSGAPISKKRLMQVNPQFARYMVGDALNIAFITTELNSLTYLEPKNWADLATGAVGLAQAYALRAGPRADSIHDPAMDTRSSLFGGMLLSATGAVISFSHAFGHASWQGPLLVVTTFGGAVCGVRYFTTSQAHLPDLLEPNQRASANQWMDLPFGSMVGRFLPPILAPVPGLAMALSAVAHGVNSRVQWSLRDSYSPGTPGVSLGLLSGIREGGRQLRNGILPDIAFLSIPVNIAFGDLTFSIANTISQSSMPWWGKAGEGAAIGFGGLVGAFLPERIGRVDMRLLYPLVRWDSRDRIGICPGKPASRTRSGPRPGRARSDRICASCIASEFFGTAC